MLIAFSETVFRTLSQKGWANASTAAEFLTIAAEIPLRPQVRLYPLAEANRALLELQRGSARGVKVLRIQ